MITTVRCHAETVSQPVPYILFRQHVWRL